MADYYRPPSKKVMVHLRMPEDLRDHLDGIVDLWRAMAVAQGHDPDDIDRTHVVERLLRVGVDGVWAQAGAAAGLKGMPTTKEEMERLKASIVAPPKASKKQH